MVLDMPALRQGDQQEFAVIFHSFYAPLCAYAARLLPGDSYIEDIVADSFTSLWQYRLKLNTHEHIKHFLYLIVRNGCHNRRKHLRVQRNAIRELTRLARSAPPDPHHLLIQAELVQHLVEGINKMPPRIAEVIRLAWFDDMASADIALRLNISCKTVLNHRLQALNRLKGLRKISLQTN